MKRTKSFVPTCLFAIVSLVALAGCGSSYSSPSSPTNPAPTPTPGPAANVTIMISGMNGSQSFSPAAAPVKVGQTVSWQNNDSITHAISQDGGGLATPAIGPGATSAPIQVTTAGTLNYHCSIHPSMTGSLNVTP
jgi:plastocyanin